LALWIVLPVLSWGIFLPILTWVISLLATEFSLLLAAYAVAGLGLAALCWRNGARRAAVVALAFGAATVALSLLPPAQAWRTARAEGVSLSLREYFAGTAFISDRSPNETRVYARPEGSEGEKLELDIYEAGGRGPESAARSASRPAVIMVHGGFFQVGRRSSETARWDAWLADEGYVVFDIDYRLSPPPRWKDAPGDVKCAVGWVKENAESYGVDPDRIALMGNSAGGHLSLLAAYTQGNPRLPPSCETGDTSVAAVVGFYSPTDLTPLCPDVDDECALQPFTGATPATNPDRYRLVSPISHVDSSDPPTFLVQGGRDSFTPPGQSPLLARRLEEAGVEHRLLELPYAQHGFDLSWGGWGSQITRPELERFLEQHLGRQSPKTQ
jgi:acetyl esterase/lipase